MVHAVFDGKDDYVAIEPAIQDADAKRYRWLRERNAHILRAIAYGSKAACQVDKGPDESEDDWTDRTIDAARSEVENFDRALTPDEVKELTDTPPDFVQEDGIAIYTTP